MNTSSVNTDISKTVRGLSKTVLDKTAYLYIPDLITLGDQDTLEYIIIQQQASISPGWQWIIEDELQLPRRVWDQMFEALTQALVNVVKTGRGLDKVITTTEDEPMVDAMSMFTAAITYEFSTRMQTAVNNLKWLVPNITDEELLIFYRLAEDLENGYAMCAINSVMYQQPAALTPVWVLLDKSSCEAKQCKVDERIETEEEKYVQSVLDGLDYDPRNVTELNKREWDILTNRVIGPDLIAKGNERILEIKDVSMNDILETLAFIFKREINVNTSKDVDVTLISDSSMQKVVASIPTEKREGLELLGLAQDERLFQLLGPANPFAELEIDPDWPNDECVIFGGCRMLTCKHFPGDEEDDTPRRYAEDWFTGECEACAKIITKRSHALRMPMIGGGWYGCFCVNLNCIIEAIYDKFREKNIRNAYYRLLANILDLLLTTKLENN